MTPDHAMRFASRIDKSSHGRWPDGHDQHADPEISASRSVWVRGLAPPKSRCSCETSGVAIMRVDLTPLLPLPMTGGSEDREPWNYYDSGFLAGSVEFRSSLEALSTQLTVMLKAGGQSLLVGVPEDQAKPFAHPALSRRQLEILGLLAEGKTNTKLRAQFRDRLTLSSCTFRLYYGN